MTQLKGRPPTFAVWINAQPSSLPDSFVAFLENRLRDEFDLHGIPIRILFRSTSKDLSQRIAAKAARQAANKTRNNANAK